jgi:hypothetical protein
MPCNSRKLGLAIVLTCVCLPLAGQAGDAGTPPAVTRRPVFGPQPVVPPPPTLEQLPASAPHVAFRSGQLTIVARNSSLGAILREVQTKTGASVDMSANPTERVVGQFGPGPAREVLASLLNGSHFNYVLLGSPQDPTSLEKIVLLNKAAGTDDATGGSQAPNTAQMSPNPMRQGAMVVPNEDADDPNSQDPPEEMMEPEQTADDQAAQNDEQQSGQQVVKTPQQLLQELQRQQQLQQQQVQQGIPQGTPPPQLQNRLQQQ